MDQMQAAQEALRRWLAHPAELGRAPGRMNPAGTFELHGLRYYMFKYKPSPFFGRWLLGVCGGYESGQSEHCGHVFSEMEPYDPDTAVERSIAMVENIRHYWMAQAASAQPTEQKESKDAD